MNWHELRSGRMTWINIHDPDPDAVAKLRDLYRFHPLDFEDVLSHNQRSKIDRYPEYLFMVILFPTYRPETREIIPVEMDVFLMRETLITVTHDRLRPLEDFYRLCQDNSLQRDHYFGEQIERLVVELFSRLLIASFPMVDHITMDLENIEQRIFRGEHKHMVSGILIARRNITDFRRIVQGHKKIIEKMTGEPTAFKNVNGDQNRDFTLNRTDGRLREYYDNLVDYTKEVWDTLNGHKETVEALQASNESFLSTRITDVIQRLTLISVMLLPVTAIAGIFGMNTRFSPFIGHAYDFWIIIALTAFVMGTMYLVFRSKKWI